MTMHVETDPKKIAERLAQTAQARQKHRPKSREALARQLQDHARTAQQSSEKAKDKQLS